MPRLDLVIFGATGFTGKATVAEMTRLIKEHPGMTWGVAGRSEKKLQDIMAEVSNKTGEDLSGIDLITADVKDEQSLKDMCNRAKVLVNCCGPYEFYGEPVVKAAIERRTHYVDVSGEPKFIEKMQLKYHKQAEEAGVYVVSACGFDSIPNDMGVIFLQQNFGGTVNSVESYISTKIPEELRKEAFQRGAINYGTWESLVNSLATSHELKAIRKELYPEPMPQFKPKLQHRWFVHKRNGRWCLPFMGADASIVYRTQRHMHEVDKQRPVQFRPYLSLSSLLETISLIIGFAIISVMAKWECTRKLLLDYPRWFTFGLVSREGPSQQVTENTSFSFYLYGEGWQEGTEVEHEPNRQVLVKVSGKNPGYGATVVGLLWSACTLLNEQAALPGKGGVLTTGIAFKNTNIINNLIKHGVAFEILQGSTNA